MLDYSVFSEVFPELVDATSERQFDLLWGPLANKTFEQCFPRVLQDPCAFQYRLLWAAHIVWYSCHMAEGGNLKQVKQVNSSETYNSLTPDRYLSNLSLSPYGAQLNELAALDYFGAGAVMGCCE